MLMQKKDLSLRSKFQEMILEDIKEVDCLDFLARSEKYIEQNIFEKDTEKDTENDIFSTKV